MSKFELERCRTLDNKQQQIEGMITEMNNQMLDVKRMLKKHMQLLTREEYIQFGIKQGYTEAKDVLQH